MKECDFVRVDAATITCPDCGKPLAWPADRPLPRRNCGEFPARANEWFAPLALLSSPAAFVRPQGGPGTELMQILETLKLHDEAGCGCASKALQMDIWGITGCRQNLEVIVTWLKESYAELDWPATIAAAAAAVQTGLAKEIDPRDPPRSLALLAIRRAEQQETTKSTKN